MNPPDRPFDRYVARVTTGYVGGLVPFATLAGVVLVAMPNTEAKLSEVTIALIAVYLFGHVTASLWSAARDCTDHGWAWTWVRLCAGLIFSSTAFLLSLVAGVPWLTGPIALVVIAIVKHGRAALAPIRVRTPVDLDTALGVLNGLLVLLPIVVSSLLMSGGEFSPFYLNVDTPYFLQLAHSLTHATTYPPPSLSNLGGVQTYHFGFPAVVALLARVSGLLVHQTLFVIVIPTFVGGTVAAAALIITNLGRGVPRWLGIPLVLISVPSFWYGFFGPFRRLMANAVAGSGSYFEFLGRYEEWGVASIVGHNVGAHFLVLAVVAGILAAPRHGWRLPVWLIGTALLVKVPTGVAMLTGFGASQGFLSLKQRRTTPLIPVVGALLVFVFVYLTFFRLSPAPPEFAAEIDPFYHLRFVAAAQGITNWMLDLLWVFSPMLIIGLATRYPLRELDWSLLLLALSPLLVVNLTHMVDVRPGGGDLSPDWLQILLFCPSLLHVLVLSNVNARWPVLTRRVRTLVVLLLLTAVAPVLWVATRYTATILSDPSQGHEYADNSAIGPALASIPVAGSVIVTNDATYYGQGFSRDDRQMQIPALFGHQAFAVNYMYEKFAFSRERHALQQLLAGPTWNDEISSAAQRFGWTHLLIRTDSPHPADIPLHLTFANAMYAVYSFTR